MAGLTRWDPFGDALALQEQMSRLLDERFRSRLSGETSLAQFAPAVDVYEDPEGIMITAEVPGIDPKDVEVKVEDGTLTMSGTRKLENEEKKENYHRIERSYGSFYRSFSLPPTVDVEKIEAETKNGVLRIKLPRREESKPRTISVNVQ